MRLRLALAATIAFTALAPSRARAETVVEGKRATVRSALDDDASARRAEDACEATIDAIEERFPLHLPEGEKLIVHLYADSKGYADACRSVDALACVDNLAFTSNRTHESYLAIVPRVDPEYLKLVGGLSEFMCFLVSHEVVHQYFHRCGELAAYLFWPDWFTEGMADALAEAAIRKLENAPEDPIPCVDDKVAIVRDALAEGHMLTLPHVLYASFASFSPQIAIYAHSYTLFRFLTEDGDRLRKLLARFEAVSGPPGKEGDASLRFVCARECAKALAEVYGPLDELEKAWRDRVSGTRPLWREYIHAAQRSGDEIVCAGYPGLSSCLLAFEKPPAGDAFSLSCELELTGIGKAQADIYFGHDAATDRFLKVAIGLEGDRGFVTLMAFEDGHWQDGFRSGVSLPASSLALGDWLPVSLEARADAISVSIRGKTLLQAAVPPAYDPRAGRWGIGAFDGVVLFRKVQVGG